MCLTFGYGSFFRFFPLHDIENWTFRWVPERNTRAQRWSEEREKRRRLWRKIEEKAWRISPASEPGDGESISPPLACEAADWKSTEETVQRSGWRKRSSFFVEWWKVKSAHFNTCLLLDHVIIFLPRGDDLSSPPIDLDFIVVYLLTVCTYCKWRVGVGSGNNGLNLALWGCYSVSEVMVLVISHAWSGHERTGRRLQ